MILSSIRLNQCQNSYVSFGKRKHTNKYDNFDILTPSVNTSVTYPAEHFFANQAENVSVIQKFNAVISPEEIKNFYTEAGKYLNLDIMPKLNLYPTYYKGRAGGYNYQQNFINMNMSDVLQTDFKILGRKGNDIFPLYDIRNELPLYYSKDIANEFIKISRSRNYDGFDAMFIKPTSIKEKKRYICQRLMHELIHAQQHMLIRQTEGIEGEDIIRTWLNNRIDPENIEKMTVNLFKTSFWANRKPTPKIYKQQSPTGRLALRWLNAIKNYPVDINSTDYNENEIEKDAYKRSAEYTRKIFGPLEV